jgi:hypothetical protein
METHQRLTAQQPDDVTERARVLVEDRRAADEGLVPRTTSVDGGDRESHVGDAREFGHDVLLERLTT